MKFKIKMVLALAALWVSGLVSGVLFASPAFACDGGTWADPTHAYVCQPYPPAYSPGYQQPPQNSMPLPPNSRFYPH